MSKKRSGSERPKHGLLGMDLLLPPGDRTERTLDQDLIAQYGVLSAIVDEKLSDCLGFKPTPGSDMDRYNDAFVVVAIEAAHRDPRLFRHFATLYGRGPGGTFAANSELVEPISRPEFDAMEAEWRHTLGTVRLTPVVRLFNHLALIGNILEFRVRPFLFALAYLVDVTSEAKERGGPSTVGPAAVNERFRNHFFYLDKEYWGTQEVDLPSTKPIRRGASTVLREALERAKGASTFDAPRIAALHEFRKSLLHDDTPPQRHVAGSDYRFGITELRNHLQHANMSFRGDRIAFGHAAIYWDYLSQAPQRRLVELPLANIEAELGRLEGLMCLVRAWETTLNNLNFWLTTWNEGEPLPLYPAP